MNADLFKRAAYLLKKRTAPTLFEWVKGHQGVQGNEESDKLAKEGASKHEPDRLPLLIRMNSFCKAPNWRQSHKPLPTGDKENEAQNPTPNN